MAHCTPGVNGTAKTRIFKLRVRARLLVACELFFFIHVLHKLSKASKTAIRIRVPLQCNVHTTEILPGALDQSTLARIINHAVETHMILRHLDSRKVSELRKFCSSFQYL